MSDNDMKIPTVDLENCTHDCRTCQSACDTADGPRKPSFFDQMERISEAMDAVGEDEILRMLNDAVSEWEAEDAAASEE